MLQITSSVQQRFSQPPQQPSQQTPRNLHPSEQDLDSIISKILSAVQQDTRLHSFQCLENYSMESRMDNKYQSPISSSHPLHPSAFANRSFSHSKSSIDVPGQTTSKISPNGLINDDINSKLVIVMVGLPARGKSYLTKKITKYLNWLQYNTKIFNVGNTRRLSKENKGPAPAPIIMNEENISNKNSVSESSEHDANFFDPKNSENLMIREVWAMDTLDQLINYLTKEDGTVGIFDATNTTKLRRRHIIEAIRKKTPHDLKILFLESICTDQQMIQRNIRLKLSGPDYKDKDPKIAIKDFKNRLANYEKAYETLDDDEEEYYDSIGENLQYIKIINAGKKITSYNISGFLSSQVVFFMLNFNLNERQIWIARHGQTYDNLEGKLGYSKKGSRLTPLGLKYSKCLAKFMNYKKKEFRLNQLQKHYINDAIDDENEIDENSSGEQKTIKSTKKTKVIPELHFSVWTSMLSQTVQTSNFFNDSDFNIKQLKMLNELSHGKVNGFTLQKFNDRLKSDFVNYQQIYHDSTSDAHTSRRKLLYRFPGGESYLDVINRLRPLIVELERLEDHVLLITHKVVARVLLSYFMNLDTEYITELDVPLHSVYVLEPKPYGVDWNMYSYDSEMDWFYPVEKEQILKKKKKREIVITNNYDDSLVSTSPMSNKKQNGGSNSSKNKKQLTSFYISSPTSLDSRSLSLSQIIQPQIHQQTQRVPSSSNVVIEMSPSNSLFKKNSERKRKNYHPHFNLLHNNAVKLEDIDKIIQFGHSSSSSSSSSYSELPSPQLDSSSTEKTFINKHTTDDILSDDDDVESVKNHAISLATHHQKHDPHYEESGEEEDNTDSSEDDVVSLHDASLDFSEDEEDDIRELEYWYYQLDNDVNYQNEKLAGGYYCDDEEDEEDDEKENESDLKESTRTSRTSVGSNFELDDSNVKQLSVSASDVNLKLLNSPLVRKGLDFSVSKKESNLLV